MAKKKEVLEVVRIFIASPGDVRKERTIFHDVIEDLNEIKAARVGMHLVPVGWGSAFAGMTESKQFRQMIRLMHD